MQPRTLFVHVIACLLSDLLLKDVSLAQFISEQYDAKVGQTVTLACETSGESPPDWAFQSKSGEQQEIAREGIVMNGWKRRGATTQMNGANKYSLVIPSVKLDESGTYLCIEDAGMGTSYTTTLVVLDLPVYYTTRVNRSVMLPCFSDADTPVDWQFQKYLHTKIHEIAREGRLINGWASKTSIQPIATGDHSLIIKNPQVDNSGTYMCSEDAGFGQNHVLHLNVSYSVDTTSVRAYIGSSVVFDCMLHNSSAFRWRHTSSKGNSRVLFNGSRLRDDTGRMRVYTNIGYHRSVLVIDAVDESDAGTFVCSQSDQPPNQLQFQLNIIGLTDADQLAEVEKTQPVQRDMILLVVVPILSVMCILLAVVAIVCWRINCLRRNDAQAQPDTPTRSLGKPFGYPDGQIGTGAELSVRRQPTEKRVKASRLPSNQADGPTSLFTTPIEMNEIVLMRSYLTMFVAGLKSPEAEQTAYVTLAAVSSDWWQTLKGWPQSNTRNWLRHRVRRVADDLCRPYRRHPVQVNVLPTVKSVWGVAELNGKIYIVGRESNIIKVFGPNKEQLSDIVLKGLTDPWDIVACNETDSLFIADYKSECIWRMSADGEAKHFLPNEPVTSSFHPLSLSVTSGRLLMTSIDDQLVLYATETGDQLKSLSLHGKNLTHAIETPRGTFIISHAAPRPQVSEIDDAGNTIRWCVNQQHIVSPRYLAMDAQGNVFVADNNTQRVLLLNKDMRLDRILLDVKNHQLVRLPWCMRFLQDKQQLIVGGSGTRRAQVFDLGRHVLRSYSSSA